MQCIFDHIKTHLALDVVHHPIQYQALHADSRSLKYMAQHYIVSRNDDLQVCDHEHVPRSMILLEFDSFSTLCVDL